MGISVFVSPATNKSKTYALLFSDVVVGVGGVNFCRDVPFSKTRIPWNSRVFVLFQTMGKISREKIVNFQFNFISVKFMY